eukprot:727975-Alexandrium_andersonii.AAC.1
MGTIQQVWDLAESCTALQENVGKRVEWRVCIRQGRLVVEGNPAKALGVVLPGPRQPHAEWLQAKVTKACREARRVAHLPVTWVHRRQVTAGGVVPSLSWAQLCKPLRRVDVKLFNAAVR